MYVPAFLHYLASMSGQTVQVSAAQGKRLKGFFHTALAFPNKDFILCLKASTEVSILSEYACVVSLYKRGGGGGGN